MADPPSLIAASPASTALACTVSTPEKERLAREARAAEVIRYGKVADVAGEVRRVAGGDGCCYWPADRWRPRRVPAS
ncbi:MAG: hypothetical protein ACRDRP_01735 [Pseudonocardiaceae bacterium]